MGLVKIRLIHSPISCPPDQRATVRGLGLRRLYGERLLQDTPAVRGMIHKVCHLVSVIGTQEGATPAKKSATPVKKTAKVVAAKKVSKKAKTTTKEVTS